MQVGINVVFLFIFCPISVIIFFCSLFCLFISHYLCSIYRPCNVRLVGGHSRCAGRVEVLHRGQWEQCAVFSGICLMLQVVCRELDCGEPVDAMGDAHFGVGSGPVWMSIVFCTGSESTLKNCGTLGHGGRLCGPSKDVGVICSGKVF